MAAHRLQRIRADLAWQQVRPELQSRSADQRLQQRLQAGTHQPRGGVGMGGG